MSAASTNTVIQGKVAVVTGASSGIGEATALALAGAGGESDLSGVQRDKMGGRRLQ